MAYVTPVVDWNEARDPAPEDLNRIEGNTVYLKGGLDAEIITRAADDTTETNARIAADNVLTASIASRVLVATGTVQGVGQGDVPTFEELKLNLPAPYHGNSVSYDNVFDAFAGLMATGETYAITGAISEISITLQVLHVSYMVKTSTTRIDLYGLRHDYSTTSGGTLTNIIASNMAIVDGSPKAIQEVSITPIAKMV